MGRIVLDNIAMTSRDGKLLPIISRDQLFSGFIALISLLCFTLFPDTAISDDCDDCGMLEITPHSPSQFLLAQALTSDGCPSGLLPGPGIHLSELSLLSPQRLEVDAGGPSNIATCGIAGRGYFTFEPSYSITLSGMETYSYLDVSVEATCDTTLLINTPNADWFYDDDSAGNLQPNLTIRASASLNGRLDLWVGTYSGDTCPAIVQLAGLQTGSSGPGDGSAPPPQPAPAPSPVSTSDNLSGVPWQEIIDNAGLNELSFQEFPAPSASWTTMVADHFCADEAIETCQICTQGPSENCLTLGDITQDISDSLTIAGFPSTSVHYGIDGNEEQTPVSILITPGERILDSGESATSGRFNLANPYSPRNNSIIEYARTFFNGNSGRMRFFVIVVGGDYFFAQEHQQDAFAVMKTAAQEGRGPISPHLFEVLATRETRVSVMVYEFESVRGESPEQVDTSEHTSLSHLQYAGVSAFTLDQ